MKKCYFHEPSKTIQNPGGFCKEGAMTFSRIRSYGSTLQKNHLSIIEGLVQAVEGGPGMLNYPYKCQFENLEIQSDSAYT
jgi:hypothetical protein